MLRTAGSPAFASAVADRAVDVLDANRARLEEDLNRPSAKPPAPGGGDGGGGRPPTKPPRGRGNSDDDEFDPSNDLLKLLAAAGLVSGGYVAADAALDGDPNGTAALLATGGGLLAGRLAAGRRLNLHQNPESEARYYAIQKEMDRKANLGGNERPKHGDAYRQLIGEQTLPVLGEVAATSGSIYALSALLSALGVGGSEPERDTLMVRPAPLPYQAGQAGVP